MMHAIFTMFVEDAGVLIWGAMAFFFLRAFRDGGMKLPTIPNEDDE